MKKSRTAVTIDSCRTVVVSRIRRVITTCVKCDARAEMVSVEDAAIVSGESSRTIFRLVEREQLHSLETSDGLLLVCLNSLSKSGALRITERVPNSTAGGRERRPDGT